jgi:hypothetical protein
LGNQRLPTTVFPAWGDAIERAETYAKAWKRFTPHFP